MPRNAPAAEGSLFPFHPKSPPQFLPVLNREAGRTLYFHRTDGTGDGHQHHGGIVPFQLNEAQGHGLSLAGPISCGLQARIPPVSLRKKTKNIILSAKRQADSFDRLEEKSGGPSIIFLSLHRCHRGGFPFVPGSFRCGRCPEYQYGKYDFQEIDLFHGADNFTVPWSRQRRHRRFSAFPGEF